LPPQKLYQNSIINVHAAYRTLQAYDKEMRIITLAAVEAAKLPPVPTPPQRKLSSLWPRMPCHTLCGYTNEMRRPHISCFWFCRTRRFLYGKMDKNKFMYNRLTGMVVTRNLKDMHTHCILLSDNVFDLNCGYVMNIFDKRRFAKIKDILMKKLFQLYDVWWIPHKKTILTFCEGLAN